MPTPAPNPQPHFWLAKPLPGGGRPIISNVLPYGSDAHGRYLLHNGSDFSSPQGIPLLAAGDGIVAMAGSDQHNLVGWRCDWYGQMVVIKLDRRWQEQPLYILYGHVQNIEVAVGDRVATGQQIAEVGQGGAAVVPHLHFEIRAGDNEFAASRNPLLWFDPGGTRGVIAGRLVDPQGRAWQGYPIQLVGPTGDDAGNLTVWSYLDDPEHIINSDEGYAENFVVADLKPGEYFVVASVQGTIIQRQVEVTANQVTTVELMTDPYKTPTPTPNS